MAKRIAATPTAPTPTQAGGGLSAADLGIADGVDRVDLPALDPRAAALLTVHPERWCVMAGEVIPLCGRLPLELGINSVRALRGGGITINQAVTERRKRRWITLMPDIEGPGTSYLYPAAPGVILTQWETAHAGSSEITSDDAAYAKWFRSLIRAGKIPGPAPYVLQRMASSLRQQILALQDKVRTVPSAQVDLDRRLADLKVVEKELRSAAVAPIPKNPIGLEGLAASDAEDQE